MNSEKWSGFLRSDGRIGIRNHILVIYTVECASFVAQQITQKCATSDVECIGFSGCTDNEYAIRMLAALIRHPNVGGVLCVGLGCEYVQPERLSQIAKNAGKLSDWFFIQDCGGTSASIARGTESVNTMLSELKKTPRAEMGFSDLVIGAECGGSDWTSGLAGNMVVGRLFDNLVDCGGTAVFEEIVEAVGLVDLLSSRAANDAAKEDIIKTYNKALDYCKSVRQYSVSPGNFAGGLSTIEEKSMGAVIKSGSRAIDGVIKVAETPPHKGLWLLDTTPDPHWMQFGITNPNDNEGLMALASCGCHLTFLITGRGNVIGSAVSPIVKITGNSDTFERMNEDMDFDAGRVLSGLCSPEELTDELRFLVAQTASGVHTKSERLGHKEYCIPYKYQEPRATKCRRLP